MGDVVGAPTIIGASSDTVTFNNEDYSIYNFQRSSSLNGVGALINTNCPIYSVDETTLQGISNGDNLDSILSDDNQINTSLGGGGYSNADILNNEYLGENNYIGITGSSINNADLKLIIDFNEEQVKNLSDYSYTINMSFYCRAILSDNVVNKQLTKNIILYLIIMALLLLIRLFLVLYLIFVMVMLLLFLQLFIMMH